MDENTSVRLTLSEGAQTLQMAYESECDYSQTNYEAKLAELDKSIKQIACAYSNTLFVMEDESLYGVGKPNTYRERYNDSYSQGKSWYAIEKPWDCTDYLKVVASGSNRLILTKNGQLFC